MNKTMLERLALEAGLIRRQHHKQPAGQPDAISWRGTDEALARFAWVIAEECANLAESERLEGPETHADDTGYQDAIRDVAEAIRAGFPPPSA